MHGIITSIKSTDKRLLSSLSKHKNMLTKIALQPPSPCTVVWVLSFQVTVLRPKPTFFPKVNSILHRTQGLFSLLPTHKKEKDLERTLWAYVKSIAGLRKSNLLFVTFQLSATCRKVSSIQHRWWNLQVCSSDATSWTSPLLPKQPLGGQYSGKSSSLRASPQQVFPPKSGYDFKKFCPGQPAPWMEKASETPTINVSTYQELRGVLSSLGWVNLAPTVAFRLGLLMFFSLSRFVGLPLFLFLDSRLNLTVHDSTVHILSFLEIT